MCVVSDLHSCLIGHHSPAIQIISFFIQYAIMHMSQNLPFAFIDGHVLSRLARPVKFHPDPPFPLKANRHHHRHFSYNHENRIFSVSLTKRPLTFISLQTLLQTALSFLLHQVSSNTLSIDSTFRSTSRTEHKTLFHLLTSGWSV